MPYGKLTSEMEEAIRPYIAEKFVWDLGAGDMAYAARLRDLEAYVTAVDKEPLEDIPCVCRYQGTFEKLASHQLCLEVAFVSWPCNWRQPGLGTLMQRSETVIYLGLNSHSKGSACGGSDFWESLIHRPILCSAEHPRNRLLVYGSGHVTRELHPEEEEALYPQLQTC